MQPVGPAFCADSAYAFCQQQCDFGPRTMNSQAHDDCGRWIMQKFSSYGLQVTPQHALLKGYDGTMLRSTNIIASYRPELTDRILICAHWDSRPWADNDPDEANWHKPVLAANDGASGVAVMLELARLLHQPTLHSPYFALHSELISSASMLRTGERHNGTAVPIAVILGLWVLSIGLPIPMLMAIRPVMAFCSIWLVVRERSSIKNSSRSNMLVVLSIVCGVQLRLLALAVSSQRERVWELLTIICL